MLGCVAVDRQHVVDIVILHRVNQIFHQVTINLKPIEVLGGILLRNNFSLAIFVVRVSGLLAKLHDIASQL